MRVVVVIRVRMQGHGFSTQLLGAVVVGARLNSVCHDIYRLSLSDLPIEKPCLGVEPKYTIMVKLVYPHFGVGC